MFVHLTLVPYHSVGRRTEDQADAALGEGAAERRHPAADAAVPLRSADPGERAAQDRAVLQRAAAGGDRGTRRRLRSTPCRSATTPRAWTAKCCGISTCRPTTSRSVALAATSSKRSARPEGEVRIAVVGKYTNLLDSYKSLAEALTHGGIANRVKVQLDWVDSEIFEHGGAVHRLEERQRHPGAGRLRRARHAGQDRGGPLRAREERAVLRHLLRHADGGDRGGAQSRRPALRLIDRVRPVRRAGGRPADRMGARQRDRAARWKAATSAARCGSARIRRC